MEYECVVIFLFNVMINIIRPALVAFENKTVQKTLAIERVKRLARQSTFDLQVFPFFSYV